MIRLMWWPSQWRRQAFISFLDDDDGSNGSPSTLFILVFLVRMVVETQAD